MEIIRQAAEVLASLFDCIIIIYFLNRYFEVKYKSKLIVSTFGIIPLFMISHYLANNFALQFVLQLVMIYAYALTFLKGSRLKKVVFDFGIIIVMSIISLTTIQVVTLSTGISAMTLVEPGTNQRIIALVISKLLLIFVTYIYLHMVKEDGKLKRDEWILIIIYFLSAAIISIFLLNIIVSVNMNVLIQIEMISVTVLLLAITGVSFVLVGKISKEKEYESVNKILKMQLEEQKLSLLKTQKMYDDTRKLKHNISSHFSIFVNMLKNNEIEEAISKMEEFVELKSDNLVIFIRNNNMINAVLNEKNGICNSNKIPFDIKICCEIETEKELETAIMLSNLLNNAIEAEMKLTGERKIILEIFRHKGIYNMIVTNNIEISVLKFNANLCTNKKDSKEHGIGLLSVRDTVNKFDGNFDCYENNNQFAVHIMIPN